MKNIFLEFVVKTLLGILCVIIFTYIQANENISMVKESQINNFQEVDRPILECIIVTTKKSVFLNETCKGIVFDDENISGDKNLLKSKLEKFLNRPITDDIVTDVCQTIIDYYKKQKLHFVAVDIPDQDISSGSVTFIVTEAKTGKIKIKDQNWTKETDVIKEIRLEEEGPINVDILQQDLYWLNRNPFRQAYAIYTPGEKKGTTDIEIHIKDRLPVRAYLGMDNIGNEVTGYNRMFGGLLLGNLWKDQMLSYQYTIGSTLKKFQSHYLQYTIPFSWRHQLLLIGGYSYYKTHYTVDDLSQIFYSKGMALQLSTRYDIPLVFSSSLGDVTAGFDFKRTNNNVEFSKNPVFGTYSNLTQFMAGYNMGGKKDWIDWNFQIEGFYSPFKWVADQTDDKYNTIRSYAKVKYAYLRSSSVCDFILPRDFYLSMYARWQLASENLLPSEMYGLGGFDTVRGYKERVYNVDHAILYNLEFKCPPFSLFGEKDKGKWKVLAFFDMGYGWKNHKAPTERKSDGLFSIGPGIRYSWIPYVTARLDWGFQLKTRNEYGTSHNRGHFSVIVGF